MQPLRRGLRYGARMLFKQPGFTAGLLDSGATGDAG
jgi:hypothetical protein